MTVCGPIPASQLGVTSMHDHIQVNAGFYKSLFNQKNHDLLPIDLTEPVKMNNLSYLHHGYQVYSDDNWNLTDVDLMEKEVSYFKNMGGQTILETSAPGIRRNIAGLQRISQITKVNLIASTGFYVEESWSERFCQMTIEDFITFLRQEIEEGIDGTSIKAGHIKTAILKGSELEFKFGAAAIRVANETGLLVTAHTSSTTTPSKRRMMLKKFLAEGIKPEKLLFCHLQFSFFPTDIKTVVLDPASWKLNLDWAKELLDSGVNICIDLFGSPYDMEVFGRFDIPDMVKMAGLVSLIKDGYSDQIVIGNDIYQKIMTRRYGGHGYCRILDFVVPTLRQMGIKEEDIEKIIVENPARMLQY